MTNAYFLAFSYTKQTFFLFFGPLKKFVLNEIAIG